MSERPRFLEFPQHGDKRGHLVVVEGGSDVPFEIRRAFYMYGSDPDVVRGEHANRLTEFVLVNVSGTSKVRTIEPDGVETVFDLDRPHVGVYVPRMTWKDMYAFSEDSVLLVLASEHYDGTEYIRDFAEFQREVGLA
ncbi:FdtA/QdtA family cupin domain-containing protein [Adlercreutzia sp. ZJ138]|uniref:sugar 3,4-ketoisomerase n=1 Tax=Adlercreutzia sp. ZJ138 TaxID=2709405 RepID=UPI0013EAF495|nr:FdtA/QdtA family cupin domain-containing protein [Adlercreutzia sp. ZJ138]